MIKSWLKKWRSQKGITLAELMVSLAIMGILVPALFAAFHTFIYVPAQGGAVLSSIGAVSHASDWVSKDASVAYSRVDPSTYAANEYIIFNMDQGGTYQVKYYYNIAEKAVIREETKPGQPVNRLTAASDVESYGDAGLNIITFKSPTGAATSMLSGDFKSTNWAGANIIRDASPYNVVRGGQRADTEGGIDVFDLMYLGTSKLVSNGWTLRFRELHSNGLIQFEGTGNYVYGNMNAVGTLDFSGNPNVVFSGNVQTNGPIAISGGGVIFGGDVWSSSTIDIQKAVASVKGSLYSSSNIIIGDNMTIGYLDTVTGKHIPGDIKSLGKIYMGKDNKVHGQLVQQSGNFNGINLNQNEVWGHDGILKSGDELIIDSDLQAVPPVPVLPDPIDKTIEQVIADAEANEKTVFYFSEKAVDLNQNNKKDDYGRPIWEPGKQDEQLKPGIYWATKDGETTNPDSKITLTTKKGSTGPGVSGRVTFIANEIALSQDNKLTDDPAFALHSYVDGILFWATGGEGSSTEVISMSKLGGASLQGIIYAPVGNVSVESKTSSSEFVLSSGSSMIGELISLKGAGNAGILKFASIQLDKKYGPVGTQVTVSGVGFHSDTNGLGNISLYFDDLGPLFHGGTTSTDADGSFEGVTFTIPAVDSNGDPTSIGYHEVRVYDGVDGVGGLGNYGRARFWVK